MPPGDALYNIILSFDIFCIATLMLQTDTKLPRILMLCHTKSPVKRALCESYI